MKTKSKIIILLWVSLLTFTTFADTTQFVKSTEFIRNLNHTVLEVKKIAALPILFPKIIPQDPTHNQYFSSYDSNNTAAKKSYLINIDYTINCNGVRICNVGYLRAESGKKPEIFYDLNGKNITEQVSLTQNIHGYYTKGHAMGSYFPPILQWQTNNILYSLSWDDHVADKAAMIKMVNSAIAEEKS